MPQDESRMKISVVGGGYVGLVTAACFAYLGHTVCIVDRDPENTASINEGRPRIYEPGLAELMKKNIGRNLIARVDYRRVSRSELIFICVGTPSLENGSTDRSMVHEVSCSIGEATANSDRSHIVIVKSTVPPGTTEQVVRPLVMEHADRLDIGFAMNPEFLREGAAIHDFFHPDRIIIGCNDASTFDTIASAYHGIDAPLFRTSPSTAEMIKFASNVFLATKISYANEIGNICKKAGIDVYEVMKGVGMDHRISPHFLDAGVGFGGSCLPKEVSALSQMAMELGEEPILLRSVLEINRKQPLRMISFLEKKIGSITGKRIAVLGLAFKENTDDIRNSQAIPVIQELIRKGARITVYDPRAMPNMRRLFTELEYCSNAGEALTGAEACLVMTEWPEFSHLHDEFKLMKSRVIIEGRRILSCPDIEGVCW